MPWSSNATFLVTICHDDGKAHLPVDLFDRLPPSAVAWLRVAFSATGSVTAGNSSPSMPRASSS